MAMEREDLALVAELSAQLAWRCQDKVQPRIGDRHREVTRQSSYGLRGVVVGEASNPGPLDEPNLPLGFRPRSHGDSAESVPVPSHPA